MKVDNDELFYKNRRDIIESFNELFSLGCCVVNFAQANFDSEQCVDNEVVRKILLIHDTMCRTFKCPCYDKLHHYLLLTGVIQTTIIDIFPSDDDG